MMNNVQYGKYVQEKMPKSKLGKNILLAFIVGGAICVIGQVFFEWFESLDIPDKQAAAIVSIVLIFLGALFTGVGWYDKLAKHAGAGTIVPITGFANAIVSPAMEFKSEGFILGVGAKMFIIAGPVIVFGTISSIVVGLIYALLI